MTNVTHGQRLYKPDRASLDAMPPVWVRISLAIARVAVLRRLRPYIKALPGTRPSIAPAEHRANYQAILEESTPEEQRAVIRRGQIIFGLLLYSVWAIAGEIAWIVTGRHPQWSARRLSPLAWPLVAEQRDEPEQTTPAGHRIPIPTREDFDQRSGRLGRRQPNPLAD